MAQAKPDGGWRGSPDLWLNAAYDLLLEQGIDSVKILPLAQKLNLSRTSFYWFFKDHQQLLDALLSRWPDASMRTSSAAARAPVSAMSTCG